MNKTKSKPIEFAGWLPAYKAFGDCGSHPLFDLGSPPFGYVWTRSIPTDFKEIALVDVKKKNKLVFKYVYEVLKKLFSNKFIIISFFKLFIVLFKKNVSLKDSFLFLLSRDPYSQFLLPRDSFIFFPSIPLTFNQNKWFLEIEDTTSMMWPFLFNGRTSEINIADKSFLIIFRTLVESENCLGIVTHMKSTATSLPTLLKNKEVEKKIFYAPLGLSQPPDFNFIKSLREKNNKNNTVLLFTNSWHQLEDSFFLRGGIDVLESFKELTKKYKNIKLIIRSKIPNISNVYFNKKKVIIDPKIFNILNDDRVVVHDNFLGKEIFRGLFTDSDIYLLPAARIHVVSTLEAMSYGLAPIVSDGWGFEEYIEDHVNGIIVKGRHGITSWMDTNEGFLRENYLPIYSKNPQIISEIVNSVSELIEDTNLKTTIQLEALSTIKNKYSPEKWKRNLKNAFDSSI